MHPKKKVAVPGESLFVSLIDFSHCHPSSSSIFLFTSTAKPASTSTFTSKSTLQVSVSHDKVHGDSSGERLHRYMKCLTSLLPTLPHQNTIRLPLEGYLCPIDNCQIRPASFLRPCAVYHCNMANSSHLERTLSRPVLGPKTPATHVPLDRHSGATHQRQTDSQPPRGHYPQRPGPDLHGQHIVQLV